MTFIVDPTLKIGVTRRKTLYVLSDIILHPALFISLMLSIAFVME